MDNIDNFKLFVRKNPNLYTYIQDGSMTWQKFYEIYDMYGEDNEVWNNFKKSNSKNTSLNDIINIAKNIDINKLQEGINSLSKVVGLFGDLFNKKEVNNSQGYQPRAVYKRFED